MIGLKKSWKRWTEAAAGSALTLAYPRRGIILGLMGAELPFSEVASIAIFLAKELRQNEKDVWYEMLQAHKGEQDA